MPDAMTARFDAFARHLVGLVPSWDMSRAEQKNRFIYESVVSGVLTLMREAIDSDRRDDASNFYTQLFHHERHQHDRRPQPGPHGPDHRRHAADVRPQEQ